MSSSVPLAPVQESRLKRFGAARSVDIHCHILPGIDDGPRDLNEALALAKALVQDGITDVVATPHQLGRWDGTNHPTRIRQGVNDLQNQLDQAKIPLRIHAGGEVRLDERIPKLLGAGSVLTLADQGVYLLLELPQGLNVSAATLLPFLGATGTRIVLAHAERYDMLIADPNVAGEWIEQGAALQINASSLLERNDRAEVAWAWVQEGWISLIATDAHSVGSRRPRMSEALEQIVKRVGPEMAKRICLDNPSRILDGQELLFGPIEH